MIKLIKFNLDNKQYYSAEFIKGFETGAKRQFEADSAQRKGEWYNKNEGIWNVEMVMTCTECGESFYEMPIIDNEPTYNYCPNCGAEMMRGEEDGM